MRTHLLCAALVVPVRRCRAPAAQERRAVRRRKARPHKCLSEIYVDCGLEGLRVDRCGPRPRGNKNLARIPLFSSSSFAVCGMLSPPAVACETLGRAFTCPALRRLAGRGDDLAGLRRPPSQAARRANPVLKENTHSSDTDSAGRRLAPLSTALDHGQLLNCVFLALVWIWRGAPGW